MNIFILHIIPSICAEMHCDKHVVKMILETCQMLCSVWHVTDPDYKIYEPPYKLAHKNHPCTIWTRTSLSNYNWLCELGLELCKEYTYRYGKIHASEKHILTLSEQIPPIPVIGFTIPAQAMPEVYKNDNSIEIESVIDSYRTYYFFEKNHFLSWKGKIAGRDEPAWITNTRGLFE